MAAGTSSANMRSTLLTFFFFFLMAICLPTAQSQSKKGYSLITRLDDFKDFKKLLRTKTNLLVICTKTEKSLNPILPVIQTAAEEMKGKATFIIIDCSSSKKLCKKLKSSPSSVDLKHYHDGEFNRDYDRKLTVKSMIKFLQDPKGDIPWDEDPDAENIVHMDSEQKLNKMLKKQRLPMLLMFYAPWCGFCKRLKPEFSAAASELKGKAILAGLDVDHPQFFQLRSHYNITGFPTIYYFVNGKPLYRYGGESTKDGIVQWMANPGPPKETDKDSSWADEESDVVHLTSDNFDKVISQHSSVLIMFYAPWCGHCKKMKPEYTEAAATLITENIDGVLAALDATKESKINERYKVKGFPTVKYFRNGEYVWDFNARKASEIVSFMKDPKEPPPPPPPEPKWEEIDSDVNHLTADNFKTFLRKKKHSLVMFYAPWCGHCKKAKPEFMEAATQLKAESKLALCAVDCTQHSTICTAHDVKGYPTLKYFNYGKNPQNYMGGRTAVDFINFLKSPNMASTPESVPVPKMSPQEEMWVKEAGSTAKDVHLLNSGTFEPFIREHSSALVMFNSLSGATKGPMKEFALAASILKEERVPGVFAAVDGRENKGLADLYAGTKLPVLTYFKNGELVSECMGHSVHEMVTFMKNPTADSWSSSSSTVYNPNAHNFQNLLAQNNNVFVAFHLSECDGCEQMKTRFLSTVDAMQTNRNIAFAAVNCDFNSDLCLAEKVKSYPSLKFFRNGKLLKTYTGDSEQNDFVDFLKSTEKDEL